MNVKDWAPVIAAFISGVLVNVMTNIIASRRASREKKEAVYLEQLKKIYKPIITMINSDTIPDDGYDGLHPSRVRDIDKIVQENIELVNPKLDALVWGLKEELMHDYRWNHADEYVMFDLDRKFLDYVTYNYELLKKRLHLPYNKSVFWPHPQLKELKQWGKEEEIWWYRKLRKFNKTIRKLIWPLFKR